MTHVFDLKAGFGLQNVSVTYLLTPVLISFHILNQNDTSKLAFLKETDQGPVQGRQKVWNIVVKGNNKYLKSVQKCWCGSCYTCHPTSNSPVVYNHFREYVGVRDLRKVLDIYNTIEISQIYTYGKHVHICIYMNHIYIYTIISYVYTYIHI